MVRHLAERFGQSPERFGREHSDGELIELWSLSRRELAIDEAIRSVPLLRSVTKACRIGRQLLDGVEGRIRAGVESVIAATKGQTI